MEDQVCIDRGLRVDVGDPFEKNCNMADSCIIFAMAIWTNPDAPVNDVVSYLHGEHLGMQRRSRFRLQLLTDISDGEHVGVLHIVHDDARLSVNEGPGRGAERWPLYYGCDCH